MDLIYIAGPMRADSLYGYKKNIERAEKVMIKWLRKGFSVISPHRNTGFLDGIFNEASGLTDDTFVEEVADDFWLKVDFEMIKRVDAIVMMKGWEESTGSTHEHTFAHEQGITVLYDEEID